MTYLGGSCGDRAGRREALRMGKIKREATFDVPLSTDKKLGK